MSDLTTTSMPLALNECVHGQTEPHDYCPRHDECGVVNGVCMIPFHPFYRCCNGPFEETPNE